MKVIVAGSRSIKNEGVIRQAIKEAKNKGIIAKEIVSGCAQGVDRIAADLARKYGLPVKEFPADWDSHGKSAGYKRNVQMAEYADALIAVHDGLSKGTAHMINIAESKGLKVFVKIVPF